MPWQSANLNIIQLKQTSPFKVSQQATEAGVKVEDETRLKVYTPPLTVHPIKARPAKCLNEGRRAAVWRRLWDQKKKKKEEVELQMEGLL